MKIEIQGRDAVISVISYQLSVISDYRHLSVACNQKSFPSSRRESRADSANSGGLVK